MERSLHQGYEDLSKKETGREKSSSLWLRIRRIPIATQQAVILLKGQ
ncbi:hypothetical protein [Sutcliffiella horikoshii]|nr:hypothetical protein [Sutcliffiella horikoshii]